MVVHTFNRDGSEPFDFDDFLAWRAESPLSAKVRQISQYPNIVRVLAADWYTWPLRWREAAERTIDALWNRLAELLNHFPPQECANYPGIPAAASRVGRD
jgi:hypothetical protein